MFTKSTKRIYELDCEKGFFIVEMEDIEETVCNTRTGATSTLLCNIYYRASKDCTLTSFFMGSYVEKGITEQEELESTYDLIVNTNFFWEELNHYYKELNYLDSMMEGN